LEYVLQRWPQLVDVADQMGDTPLHWVGKRRNYSAIRQLLQHGASVNLMDEARLTVLKIVESDPASDPEVIRRLKAVGGV
jgi:ankyrin repeat protein